MSASSDPAASPAVQRWEYCAVEFDSHKTFAGQMNALGADGWELVHVGDIAIAGMSVGYLMRVVAGVDG